MHHVPKSAYNRRMINIIPLPEKIEKTSGEFQLSADTVIHSDEANKANAKILHDLLSPPTSFPLPIQQGEPSATTKGIVLRLDPALKALGEEGYRLEVRPEAVLLSAPTTTGVFYAIQTLRQVLPVEIEGSVPQAGVVWKAPCALIEDKPRFPGVGSCWTRDATSRARKL